MRRPATLALTLCWALGVSAAPLPDTLKLSVADAESLFLRSNFQVIASRYSLEAAQAAVVQAGLWANPNIAVEQNIHNQYTGRWFDVSSSGNTGVQIQQLILLAGKRGKQERLAALDAENAAADAADLVRTLKLRLRTTMYDLYYLQASVRFYDESIATLSATVTMMEGIYERRAILLAELLRLKTLLFTLQNERLGLMARIADAAAGLRVLIGDTAAVPRVYIPLVDAGRLDAVHADSLRYADLLAAALAHRPDLGRAAGAVLREEANLAYQHSLATPDLTVGGLWSRAGSYIPDYFALTFAIDLPLFNRNQGNIALSERTLDADRSLAAGARAAVAGEVAAALQRAAAMEHLYRSFDRKFPGQYRELVEGMIASYQRRNMSVIEFTDFIESYRTSMLQMNQLGDDRADALETLNYVTGTDLFTP